MDTYQLVSIFRSFGELKGEAEISTPELLKVLSRAHRHVLSGLYALYGDRLLYTKTYSSISANPTWLPAAKAIRRLWRYATSAYKLASPLPLDMDHLIDASPQYNSTVNHPLYVVDGNTIKIYPAVSSTNVQIEYLREIPDLVYGIGTMTYSVLTTKWRIQLNELASGLEDFYNNYRLALYKADSYGAYNHVAEVTISDYSIAGSVTTDITGAAPAWLTTDTDYLYALVPMVPEDHDNLIIDMAFCELSKAGLLKFDPASLESSVNARIAAITGGANG